MKKLIVFAVLTYFSHNINAQVLEVDGKVKIAKMDTITGGDNVIVQDADSTLAKKNLKQAIISYFISLPNGCTMLFNAGESVQNLVKGGCSCESLVNVGANVQELLNEGCGCVDLGVAGANVQVLLDGGCTPLGLYDNGSGVPDDSLYGKLYEGGLIFFLDLLNEHSFDGLVSATTDQGVFVAWECSGTSISGADGEVIGTGMQNTDDIVSNACQMSDGRVSAAEICDSYTDGTYSDWFLPSIDELLEMEEKLYQGGVGGFGSSRYWSSTEDNSDDAWFFQFNIFDKDATSKTGLYSVRAARAF